VSSKMADLRNSAVGAQHHRQRRAASLQLRLRDGSSQRGLALAGAARIVATGLGGTMSIVVRVQAATGAERLGIRQIIGQFERQRGSVRRPARRRAGALRSTGTW